MRERIDQNMRALATQSTGQLVAGTVVVLGILGLMTAVGFIQLPGLVGGGLGYLAVQAYARIRYGSREPDGSPPS